MHMAAEREGEALSAKLCRAGNCVPPLLDLAIVCFFESVRQAHHAVFQFGPFKIPNSVERREFSSGELSNTFNDSLDQISLGMGELFALRELIDSSINADGEQLVLGWRSIGCHEV